MESYEILAAAEAAGIPAIVLRAVSDSVDRALPNFSAAIGADGKFALIPLVLACLSSPLRTTQLFKSSRKAIDNLEPALKTILNGELIGLRAPEPEAATPKHWSRSTT